MADEEVIAQLVLEGLSEFLNGMGEAGGSIEDTGAQAEESSGLLGSLGDAMGAVADIAQNALGVAIGNVLAPALQSLINGFIDGASGALDAEENLTRLDSVLRSTGASAAEQAAQYEAAQGKWVTSTRASATQVAAWGEDLAMARAKLSDLQARLVDKEPTEVQKLQLAKLSATVAELEGNIASGGDVIRTSLVNALGLIPPVAKPSRQTLLDLADSMRDLAGGSDDAVIAAESVLLKFENLGKDVFPGTLQASADLAAFLDIDMSNAAQQLGFALNSPGDGLNRLAKTTGAFTDAEIENIKRMAEHGDMAGAQAEILAQLNGVIGGTAETMASTINGQWEIMTNRMGDAAETIGSAFIPVLHTLFDAVIAPAIPLIEGLASGIASAITAFVSGQEGIGGTLRIIGAAVDDVIPGAYHWFLQLGDVVLAVVGFFQANLPAIQETVTVVFGAISEIVAALAGVFYESILPAINDLFGVVTTGAPSAQEIFTALMTAIKDGATIAAAFVKDVLAPAIAAFADWARTNLIPLLGELVVWLQTNLPVAIQFLTDAWNNVIYPALVIIADWVTGTLIPTLTDLWTWIQTNLPTAIQLLTDYWNNTLQPALTAIWTFISVSVIPLLTALATVITEVVRIAFEGLVNFWNTDLFPKIDALITILNITLMPILNTIGTFIGTTLTQAFASLKAQIELVTSVLWALADVLSGIHIPPDLQPGSPTPFELGLRGIGKAAQSLTRDLNPLDALLGGMNSAQIGLGFTSGGGASISQLYVQMMKVDSLVMAQAASEAPSIYAARGGGATSTNKTLNFTSNNYGRNADPPSVLGDLSLAMAVL